MNQRWIASVVSAFLFCAGCGNGATPPQEVTPPQTTEGAEQPVARQSPPDSGPRRDVSFPTVEHRSAGSLPVHVATWNQLPIVYYRLIIKSGSVDDPASRPGLSHLVGQMLQEGTRNRTSAALAEEVDFLGASLWVSADENTITIGMRSLKEHVDEALDILSDVVMNPRFYPNELAKLKDRERDQLLLRQQNPNYLASREFFKQLYGEHPYSRVDLTAETLDNTTRTELIRWHRSHFVANNAELVVVGDVNANELAAKAGREFRGFASRPVRRSNAAEPPSRSERNVLIVNRPESVQSVILIGNLALPRGSEDFISLEVANQVLGGSAAARLFMDLRERRSLTYGAYSSVANRVSVAPFYARAAVRTEVTTEAVGAFFEHLERISTEAVAPEELANAQRYLSDSFPLQIDTPGKIAGMIADLRVFGLEDDYWESYRTQIGAVDIDTAKVAAERYIRPNEALVVIVGNAAEFASELTRFGTVTVLRPDGTEYSELPAATGTEESESAEPAPAPEASE